MQILREEQNLKKTKTKQKVAIETLEENHLAFPPSAKKNGKQFSAVQAARGLECEAFYSGSGTMQVQYSLEDRRHSVFPQVRYYAPHIHGTAGLQRRRHIKTAQCLNPKCL